MSILVPTIKARFNTQPWVVEIFNGRTPTRTEVEWMLGWLLSVQELQDEAALRELQRKITEVLGTMPN
jgi:hypothetical protein